MRRLSIGKKTEKGTTKIDHFRFIRKLGYKRWESDDSANAQFGFKPTSMRVILCNDDPEKILNSQLASFRNVTEQGRGGKSYVRQVLYCYGDGETAYRLKTSDSNERDEMVCPNGDCPLQKAKKCKPAGNMYFQVPDLGGGMVELITSGWGTIGAIEDKLEEISGITGGILAGIPVTLVVKPDIARPKGIGQVTIYVVDIEYDIKEVMIAAVQMKDLRSHSTARQQAAAAAPEIQNWPDDEIEEFVDEFHPTNGNGGDGERIKPGDRGDGAPITLQDRGDGTRVEYNSDRDFEGGMNWTPPEADETRPARSSRPTDGNYAMPCDSDSEEPIDANTGNGVQSSSEESDTLTDARCQTANWFRKAFEKDQKAAIAIRNELFGRSIGLIMECDDVEHLNEATEAFKGVERQGAS